MYEITQTTGFFIINGSAYNLDNGTVVSYRSDSIVEEFDTAELLDKAHRERYPQLYELELMELPQ